jgi:hypothetical protein
MNASTAAPRTALASAMPTMILAIGDVVAVDVDDDGASRTGVLSL